MKIASLAAQAISARHHRLVATLLFLSALMAIRLILQIRLYRQGFVSVSADEFARGLRALDWSRHLRISPYADLISPWPPFEMYLNGLALRLVDDVLLAPRITVFLASCLLLAALFYLIRTLFISSAVAALAVILVAAQPWYIWLSGTPMLEMYFLAPFAGGLYFLLAWLRERHRFYWLYAGLLFLLASGFHVQSWVLINVVNLLTCGFLLRKLKEQDYRPAIQLLLVWLLGNTFILYWAVAEYTVTGQLFGILAIHTGYSLWFYGGYNVPLSEKFLYYPRLIWQNTSISLFLLATVGLVYVLRPRARLLLLLPLLLGGVTLTVTAVFNTLSGPPSAAPGRYSLFYTLLLAPYAAFGLYSLMQQVSCMGRARLVFAWRLLAGSLFLVFLASQVTEADSYPQGMSPDTIQTGHYLNHALASREPGLAAPVRNLMIEVVYWDFLALQLLIDQQNRLLFDREIDSFNREIPSLMLEDEQSIQRQLLSAQVDLLAVKTPLLHERAESLSFLVHERSVGAWAVFRVATAP
jgi:hypothetical protein